MFSITEETSCCEERSQIALRRNSAGSSRVSFYNASSCSYRVCRVSQAAVDQVGRGRSRTGTTTRSQRRRGGAAFDRYRRHRRERLEVSVLSLKLFVVRECVFEHVGNVVFALFLHRVLSSLLHQLERNRDPSWKRESRLDVSLAF